jgi:hypothetical protein
MNKKALLKIQGQLILNQLCPTLSPHMINSFVSQYQTEKKDKLKYKKRSSLFQWEI